LHITGRPRTKLRAKCADKEICGFQNMEEKLCHVVLSLHFDTSLQDGLDFHRGGGEQEETFQV
jgi:hypothetical protein